MGNHEDRFDKEIYELKNSLNKSSEEKEKAYHDCSKISAQIKNLISKLKESKNKRDALTKEVKELKAQRRELGELIKSQISELKKRMEEKKEISSKFSSNASAIKKEIAAIERKIETTVMSPEKEQQLMKLIKEKKKQLEEMRAIFDINKKIKDIKNKLNSLRNSADDTHKLIQEKAAESQRYHEMTISISRQLDSLRGNKKALLKEYHTLKAQFIELNNALKEKLLKVGTVLVRTIKKEDAEKSQRKEFLKSKEKEIEAKLKKGEKLTTEDLLVLQGMEKRF